MRSGASAGDSRRMKRHGIGTVSWGLTTGSSAEAAAMATASVFSHDREGGS